MKMKHIANMKGAQDGAIFGGYLFRFDAKGQGCVYDLKQMSGDEVSELSSMCDITLDRAEEIVPHSNAVFFGKEYYAEGDDFPLLYSNIYNNYAKQPDPLCGVCCVYRLQRDGDRFFTTLLQLIEVGFTDDKTLWRSAGETVDVRPYGNFVADVDQGVYHAFVMRDEDQTTRYFSFDLPRVTDGGVDERFGIRRVKLSAADIRDWFDVPYHRYIQGACCHGGKIYSVEGFSGEKNRPALRVIDPKRREQIFSFDFYEAGMDVEPECIDFYDGRCLYSDAKGHVYELSFEGENA